jgi:glycosyltransferase involved in cell wall biosynthesis
MTRRLEARAAARAPLPEMEGLTYPVTVQGKFFWAGERKFYVRAVSYGPFGPGSDGAQFPERSVVEIDFALMRALGANTIRTFTVPPRWLLDRAGAHGLRVLVGVPWAQHVCFLDSAGVAAEIRRTIRAAARATADHPAVLATVVGNEIPPDIVRWHGPERVARFLTSLAHEAKSLAPDVPVTYANFPPTEYLDPACMDFVSYNVYLHREEDFRRYLGRLQNLAADRPLVLTEHGIDSHRLGEAAQAAMLRWQVRAAFDGGLAGTCVFAWTDEWFTGGHPVDDWAFGLVTRARDPKPAFEAVRSEFSGPLPPPLPRYPRVSVVICACDAAHTIEACLTSLEQLRYPDYEVVVVNDGSTDATRAIVERHAGTTLVNQPNRGLSVARNVGFAHARGEIVAYTDADCVVDPDWLTYLVSKFVRDGFVAAGGPNLPPPEDNATAAYVAAAPGGPAHVLLNDEVAEHVPGCNMAFTKRALEEVGGFEPMFRAAGDDVDLCWRLQNLGHVIGFSPAAMVWHFRRNTVRAYLAQQRGYGKAEALLYGRHPYRFNMLGQSRWLGRIYGDFTTSLFSRRPVIYSGTFGRGLFQTLYEPSSSLFASLPFTLEWNVAGLVLIVAALLTGRYRALALLPPAVTAGWAMASALQAQIDARYDDWRGRLTVAALVFLGPLVRGVERTRWRIKSLTQVERIRFVEPTQSPRIRWLARELVLAYWSERGEEKEALLEGLIRFLLPRKYLVTHDLGWSRWDLAIHRGLAVKAQVRVAVENHGTAKRLFRVRCAVKLSRAAVLALAATGALAVVGASFAMPELAAAAAAGVALTGATVAYRAMQLARTLFRVLEIVAHQVGLTPLPPES